MNFGIRRATPEEADILTAIAFAAKRHWGYQERWIEQWVPLLTITPETITRLEVWCWERSDEIVAFYVLERQGKRASLEHLWVLPFHMGQGVGRALFEHAVEIARARGCDVLEIESDPNAAGFYERMGAEPAGQRASKVDGHPRVLPVFVRRL